MARYFSFARRTWSVALLGVVLLTSCKKADTEPDDKIVICYGYPGACDTPATVRDLSGLDGCGKVLELANGKRLEPHGTAWNSFPSANGQHVVIGYVPAGSVSICMVGQPVEITCIRGAD
ncbi:hypothetical protein MUN81_14105 [Hymenobacter sp. 5317J-9]|uniref:hypothetical protein n=1 Tax=Hymenobacter sp. 5317J-9 TaxID=2932250 RepID=UPI001FD63C79|nr:hypothetical protein [Hymenobacter sp. 5317J-9]UOQ96378.1 hypothetical protein MUN81_14105 [Hymenobacter sp. 5317J-9]